MATDPLARQVGKSSEVLGRREPLRLEAPHLTRRSRAPLRRFAADNPAHSRIVAQALDVVHILVSGKATKYRLPEQPGQCVPTILAGACVGQNITCHRGQAECVVEFAIGQQSGIGSHHRAAKLKPQSAVEIQPNRFRFGIKISASSFAIACALAFVADAARAQEPASSNDPFAAFSDSLTVVPAASTLNNRGQFYVPVFSCSASGPRGSGMT